MTVSKWILAGMGAVCLSGCNIISGLASGPGSDDIVNVARDQMMSNLGPSATDPKARQAMLDMAKNAEIVPKGICNNAEPEKYACMVDVTLTMPGETKAQLQTMVVELKKDSAGKWVAAQ